jgi:hypothetical protein
MDDKIYEHPCKAFAFQGDASGIFAIFDGGSGSAVVGGAVGASARRFGLRVTGELSEGLTNGGGASCDTSCSADFRTIASAAVAGVGDAMTVGEGATVEDGGATVGEGTVGNVGDVGCAGALTKLLLLVIERLSAFRVLTLPTDSLVFASLFISCEPTPAPSA